jgi:carbonic anhydrase
MGIVDEVLEANRRYAESFAKGDLPAPPARRFVIVTCMDARIDPMKVAGLDEGDAHVLRNAGAIVTDDVLRSLVVSHMLLGTQVALVIGHTGCGLEAVTDEQLRQRLAAERGVDASTVEFHAFPQVHDRVRESVRRVHESPLLPDSYTATGFVYDVRSGRLEPVA